MAARLPLLLNAILGVLAIGLAFASAGEGAPHLQLGSATGSLSLSDSKEGAAIFDARSMRPGDEASGSVTIGNTGTVTGALTLAPVSTQDAPGPGGGRLSSRLDLQVIDVTNAQAPSTVYTGTIEQMPAVALGALAPGAQRTFLFVATLTPGGVADNAFQGSTLTTAFAWSAAGSELATPTPTPTSVPTTVPDQPTAPVVPQSPAGPLGDDPTGSVLGAQVFALPASRSCLSRRKLTITLRRPAGLAFKALTITVNRKTRVKLKGLKARKVKAKISLRGLPKGKVVVKVVATTTTGRRAVTTRTYHTCATKPVVKKNRRRARR